MAQLSPVRFRATNAIGEIVVGAGLFIFQAGTSTPADIFTDDDLTTPAANPLVSGSDGYWPQVYAANGLLVDFFAHQTDDISSTLLWQALSVASVGPDDVSSFFRDFGADGRVQMRGAAGRVHLEFGDPVGDDIGGSWTIGGWNGTPFDEGVLDGKVVVAKSSRGVPATVPALDIDVGASNFHTKAISANSTFTFSGAAPAAAHIFFLQLTITSAAVPTWPASVDYTGGVNPSASLGNGRHILAFTTFNGGEDWALSVVNRALA